MKCKLTDYAMILSIKLKEIQQFLGMVTGINERGGMEMRHGWGVGRGEEDKFNLSVSAIVALKS